MKYIIVLTLLAMSLFQCYGQSKIKSFDLIIAINNDIGMGNISNPRMEIFYGNDSSKTIDIINYYPGNLSIQDSAYKILLDDKVDKIIFKFNYFIYKDRKEIDQSYEIELKKWWFKSAYNIIRIYDTDIGPYKGIFPPLAKDKPYTFELFSPDNGFTRVRLK